MNKGFRVNQNERESCDITRGKVFFLGCVHKRECWAGFSRHVSPFTLIHMSIVTAIVTTPENINAERRLDKGWTIQELKVCSMCSWLDYLAYNKYYSTNLSLLLAFLLTLHN